MAIDFNQDIAPLRQQYFPMLAGERGFDQAMKYRQEVLVPMQQQTMQMQDNQMRMRQQELAYKQQKSAFRQQRDKLRMDREYSNSIPMIEERLREIRTSEDSPMEKSEAFTDFAMGNIGLISRSPMISSMFSFQNSLMQSQMAANAKSQQAAQNALNLTANDYRQRTYATPEFDENIYRGILGGEISDQQTSSILSDAAERKKLQTAKDAEKDPIVEAAEKAYTKTESASLGDAYDETTGKTSFSQLNPEDYDELIDELLILRGIPLRRGKADAAAEFPLERSRDLLNEIRALATERISKSRGLPSSLTTPRTEEERSSIHAAFGFKP